MESHTHQNVGTGQSASSPIGQRNMDAIMKPFYLFVSGTGMVVNLLVIITLMRRKNIMAKRLSLLITNQSFIDFCCNLHLFVVWVAKEYLDVAKKEDTVWGNFVCRCLTMYFTWGLLYSSKTNLVLSNVER